MRMRKKDKRVSEDEEIEREERRDKRRGREEGKIGGEERAGALA